MTRALPLGIVSLQREGITMDKLGLTYECKDCGCACYHEDEPMAHTCETCNMDFCNACIIMPPNEAAPICGGCSPDAKPGMYR